jgi:hypothetical protein
LTPKKAFILFEEATYMKFDKTNKTTTAAGRNAATQTKEEAPFIPVQSAITHESSDACKKSKDVSEALCAKIPLRHCGGCCPASRRYWQALGGVLIASPCLD